MCPPLAVPNEFSEALPRAEPSKAALIQESGRSTSGGAFRLSVSETDIALIFQGFAVRYPRRFGIAPTSNRSLAEL